MDVEQIHEAALKQKIAPEALDTIVAQVQAHFGESQPRPVDVEQFITRLPVWTKVNMTQQEFYAMPLSWRSHQGWTYQPPAVRQQPTTRELTAEELPSLEGLPWAERLTRGRQMQQSPPPQQP